MVLPTIIQGGMGVSVSSWQLANTVSRHGQLGVVSGTGIAVVMTSKLQHGDKDGHVRRALSHFPIPEVAERIIDKYYVEGGIPEGTPYKIPPMWRLNPSQHLLEINIAANFIEVWLAKDGHNNPVGINLLEKIQMPNLASMYGAMLAGVDFVIMGAGIPMQVPGALDAFANHQPASYRVDVTGASEGDYSIHFDPEKALPGIAEMVGPLKRPMFLPIVSSVVLALALRKRANGEINGFVIEMPTAGGHNAPPRGDFPYNDRGEPIYGDKDEVNLASFRKMGLPFWLAGGYGSPDGLREAVAEGAQGVQVGTAFAYSDESGFEESIRSHVIGKVLEGEIDVLTSSVASPTGFPFKVVQIPGSISDPEAYAERNRICNFGYLRHLYKTPEGKIDYRCPSEPIKDWLRKGGKLEQAEGRRCLCNHLASACGLPQTHKDGYVEPPIVTSGDALPEIGMFIPEGQTHYSAADVINHIMSGIQSAAAD